MKNTFWDDLPRPFFILAPMEDVTDIVFRSVVARAGRPDVFMTEFTNAASFCSERGEFSTRGRLIFSPSEKPIVAQIWGKNPEHFAKMARELVARGFSGIDINMGCPDKKVVKSGGGSALIENPKLAVELIQETLGVVDGAPVSVKTRLGARNLDEWRPWLTTLLEQNLANLTVHLRTRKEMSKVPAHYELIPEIVKLRDLVAPTTKLTINGDVRDRAHGLALSREFPGIDGIMIGRGIFANPFAFEPDPREHDRGELIELLKFHLDKYDECRKVCHPESPPCHPERSRGIYTYKAQDSSTSLRSARNDTIFRNFDSLKHFFKIYVRDFDGAKELRDQLMHAKTTDEIRDLLT